MAILVMAALIILGPERLPGAMSWVAKALKQVREYASGAQTQLKDELGPEFEELKKPFDEFRGLRGMTPRGVITKHLFDGDDSLFTGNFDATPTTAKPTTANPGAPNPQHPAPSQPPSELPIPRQSPGSSAAASPTATQYDSEAT